MIDDPRNIFKVTPLVRGFECFLCGFKGGSNRRDYLVQHLVNKRHRDAVRQTRIKLLPTKKRDRNVDNKPGWKELSLTLPESIVDCVIVSGCQHGHSYASTARCLRSIARTIASILEGWDPSNPREGSKRVVDCLKRAGFKEAAKSVQRLVTLGEKERSNQEHPRSVLVRDRTTIGRRVHKIGKLVTKDMTYVLKLSKFVGASCDESVVCGKTRPMFVILQCINKLFQWNMLNAGQSNTTGNATGAAYVVNVVRLFRKVGVLPERVRSFGTDGCYAMRSNLPGVDARDGGESMIAALKIVLPNRLLAFHCLLHITQLSIRGGIKNEVPDFWEGHVRAMYTWGSRSVKRQHEFCQAHEDAINVTRQLLEVFNRVQDQHGWQWTYFDRYVIVRWETVIRCLKSILLNWPGARGVANVQREKGWGPRYYNPQDNDAPDIDNDDDRWEEVLALSNFDVGSDNAPKSKRSRLLCPRTGVTDVNWGLNAGLYVVLQPIQLVMKLLQTTKAPIQHFAARHIQTVKDHLQDVINSNWQTSGVYAPFVNFCTQQNRLELLTTVNDIVESFAASVLRDYNRRTEPYMPYYKAMELIDPTCTASDAFPVTLRHAVRDICKTHGIDDALPALRRMRHRINVGRPSVDSLNTARKNILTWYVNKVGLRELLPHPTDRKHVKRFVLAVLSINIVTAVVESTFSGIKNQKSTHRESLADEAATIAQQCRQYPDVVGSTAESTMEPFCLPSIDMNLCFTYDYSSHHGGAQESGSHSDVDSTNSDTSSEENDICQ